MYLLYRALLFKEINTVYKWPLPSSPLKGDIFGYCLITILLVLLFAAEDMSTITKNFKLGFGSFVDKVVMPYVSTAPNK